jgi:hypothetical protein
MILEAGESVVTLARWLGHSSPTITLDHYAHFMPDAGTKGRTAINALLDGPSDDRAVDEESSDNPPAYNRNLGISRD